MVMIGSYQISIQRRETDQSAIARQQVLRREIERQVQREREETMTKYQMSTSAQPF